MRVICNPDGVSGAPPLGLIVIGILTSGVSPPPPPLSVPFTAQPTVCEHCRLVDGWLNDGVYVPGLVMFHEA